MSKSERQKLHHDVLQDLPLQEASESITKVNSSDYKQELSEEQLEAIAGGHSDCSDALTNNCINLGC